MPRSAFVLIALVMVGYSVRGVLRGQIQARQLFVRSDQPFGFWLHVLTFGTCGLFLIYLAIRSPTSP